MRRLWTVSMALMVLFAVGCAGGAGIKKDTKIRCPKCGAEYRVDEGLPH